MMSFLHQIAARKRTEVAARRAVHPLHRLQHEVQPASRRFGAALARPGLRFILECKKASPSEGLLRSDFDPAAIAAIYRDFADAISVLTDGPGFQGSFDDLHLVRSRVELPVLCKDFILEPYQVLEARAAGADAVLLMLSILDDREYSALAATARELAMDVLTEVHDDTELTRAIDLDAAIIGINNRDLRTFTVDRGTTARLAPRVPRDRLVVSESGFRCRTEIDAVADHVDAFLVGSYLMRSPRLDLAVREILHGAVKVCGLTSPADAQLAYAAGAVFGGLVFAEGSPRQVDRRTAGEIVRADPLKFVGVFVNQPLSDIAALAHEFSLEAVQLHGEETPAQIAALRPCLPAGCELWKAVRVRDRLPTLQETGADRLLLDGYHPQTRGGSGRRFDWALLSACREKDRIVLAGGLDAANVRAAHGLGCAALDVSSGVESAPGVKDAMKLQTFFAQLKGAP
jgi:indole-3-glycerol phosphate synthase/phosphoribosylanthranilate isomerase